MGPLTDKYCIVGVGETAHMRPSNRTTQSMALEATLNACKDAGLDPKQIDGITSYNAMDSTSGMAISTALGMRLNYQVDIMGGGSSTEALIAHAVGLLEGGYCNYMLIFRSMNGRSGRRMGGQAPGGPMPPTPIMSAGQFGQLNGFTTPAQMFGSSCMRYMHDYGLKPETLGRIAITSRRHAMLNPKSIMRSNGEIKMEDYLASRWVSKPFRLLDCCLETDVAAAIIVTSRERAYDLKQPPVFIMGGTARTMTDNPAWNYSRDVTHYVAGFYGRNRMFGMSGVGPEDIDITTSYDAFTFTGLIQLEAYGFAPRGEAGAYVDAGNIAIDGRRPNNLHGGHLSEGYTHGISMVIENTRQLRNRADDFCPRWAEGIHTYDRSKGCRQAKRHSIAACLGW
ncbi:MAG: thiolase, partial [Chloroflexi bacterium]|nr:thiolase [Chloroflexota bacterium]